MVSPEENITRYILSSGHLNKTKTKIRLQAFLPELPPNKDSNISVYRTSSLNETQIWETGDTFVSAQRSDGKKILARGDLKTKTILDKKLNIASSKDPRDLHAEIIDWPLDEPTTRQIALELATESKLTIR